MCYNVGGYKDDKTIDLKYIWSPNKSNSRSICFFEVLFLACTQASSLHVFLMSSRIFELFTTSSDVFFKSTTTYITLWIIKKYIKYFKSILKRNHYLAHTKIHAHINMQKGSTSLWNQGPYTSYLTASLPAS